MCRVRRRFIGLKLANWFIDYTPSEMCKSMQRVSFWTVITDANTDWTDFYTCKECHKTESLWNHTTTDQKEGELLEDRRNVGKSICDSGDGTDQRVQSLMFMTMMMITDALLQYSSHFGKSNIIIVLTRVLYSLTYCALWFI